MPLYCSPTKRDRVHCCIMIINTTLLIAIQFVLLFALTIDFHFITIIIIPPLTIL